MSGDVNVMGTENTVGTELLEKFIKESVELGKTINEQLEDGWQWTDLWSIVGEGKDLAFVVNKWEQIREQFVDLTEDEIVVLVKKLVSELNITDEEIIELIDNIVQFAGSAYNLVLSFKNLKK